MTEKKCHAGSLTYHPFRLCCHLERRGKGTRINQLRYTVGLIMDRLPYMFMNSCILPSQANVCHENSTLIANYLK